MERKIRVMVVDDSSTMRTAAKAALSERFELLTAEDGLDAVAAITSFKPDIVFLDIAMPRMDGYETVALIRLNEEFARTPVLMMSSKGGVFDIARGRLLGFDGFIIKPFQSQDLQAAVEKYLPALSGVAVEA